MQGGSKLRFTVQHTRTKAASMANAPLPLNDARAQSKVSWPGLYRDYSLAERDRWSADAIPTRRAAYQGLSMCRPSISVGTSDKRAERKPTSRIRCPDAAECVCASENNLARTSGPERHVELGGPYARATTSPYGPADQVDKLAVATLEEAKEAVGEGMDALKLPSGETRAALRRDRSRWFRRGLSRAELSSSVKDA